MNRKIKKSAATKSKERRFPNTGPQKGAGKQSRFMDILARKREEILTAVQHKEADFALGEIGDELDVANQTFEREMMFEMTNGERVVLDDIEAALRKIEKGEFGFCESCRKKIPSARLQAMPWARNCIDCQSRTESQPKM